MDETAVDFDLAIDNFFDFFDGNELVDVEIPTQATDTKCRETTLEEKEKEVFVKRDTIQEVPKVMKNDIRRYYSRMFMNSINSGDFNQLQSYFSTFMSGQAKFAVSHDNFHRKYRLPAFVSAEGLKLLAHFHLGMYVMCPDNVMHMNNTRITTSNTWSGTKIEISVSCRLTKVYDLAVDDWFPQLHVLDEICNKLEQEKKNKKNLGISFDTGADSFTASEETESGHDNCSYVSSSVLFSSSDSAAEAENSVWSFGSAQSDRMAPNYTQNNATNDAARGAFNKCTEEEPSNEKDTDIHEVLPARKRKRTTHSRKDAGVKLGDIVPYEPCQNSNFIPEEYVQVLFEQARPLPAPVEIRMAGLITMFLNENHHIQYMHIRTRPN